MELHADDRSDANRPAAQASDAQAIEQILVSCEHPSAHGIAPSSRDGKPTTSLGAESNMSSVDAVRARRKSKLARSACNQCRKRKTKCSDQRPVCRLCSIRGLECSWNTIDGLTRTADLKKKVYDEVGRSNNLDTFLNAMRHGTDQVSSMLLAKLRCGMSLGSFLDEIHGESSAVDASRLDSLEEAAYARLSLVSLCYEPYVA